MRSRYLAVHLPAFALERCGYGPGEFAVVVAEQHRVLRLVALTPAALDEGLRVGMTASEARALLPEVHLEVWEPEAEHADRAELIESFRRFSDRILPLDQVDFALRVDHTAHLFEGEQALLQQVRERLERMGHQVHLAVSDDARAAWALARMGTSRDQVAAPGKQAQALANLPMSALAPSQELAQSLEALGIACIGAWAALDEVSVAARFGEEGLELHRVARGVPLGELPAHTEPPEPLFVGTRLGGATETLQPVLFALQGLLRQLSQLLERRGKMAVRLVVTLWLDKPGGTSRLGLRVRLGRPSRNVEVMARLVRRRLEDIRLAGPVLEVGIEVEETCPERGWQPGLLDRSEAAEPLPDLLARLQDALGQDAVCTPWEQPSWRPETSWLPFSPGQEPPRPIQEGKPDPVALQDHAEASLPLPRPSLWLPRAQPVEVRLEAEAPVALRTSEGWRPVTRRQGPECLSGDWWRQPFERTYWVVEVEGRAGWLCQDQQRWSWHGWFD